MPLLCDNKPKNVHFYQSYLSNTQQSKKYNVFLESAQYLWKNKNTTMLVLLIWGMPVLVTMKLEGSATMLLAFSLMLRCNNVARVCYYLFNARELAGYLSLLEERNYKEMRLIDGKLLLLNLIFTCIFWTFVILLWDILIEQLFVEFNYDLDLLLIATSIGFTLFGVRPQANIIQGIGTVRLILITVLAGIFVNLIYIFGEEVSISLLFMFMFLLNASLYFPLAKGKTR